MVHQTSTPVDAACIQKVSSEDEQVQMYYGTGKGVRNSCLAPAPPLGGETKISTNI